LTLRIGLYGGSFNPAHATHLGVSRLALARFRLDRIWWLVAPQNPLKSEADMASFVDRLAGARRLVGKDPRIVVSDAEARFGTRYSVDTVREILRRHPRHRFVLVAGADILVQLPRWKRWRRLLRLVPLAIVHRPGFDAPALRGKVAARLRRRRRPAGALADASPPAWHYCWASRSSESASAIRAGRARDKRSAS
jgi:nicotinate-nucleotide adenylyltransferase